MKTVTVDINPIAAYLEAAGTVLPLVALGVLACAGLAWVLKDL